MAGFQFALLTNVTTNAECKIQAGETSAVNSWTPYEGLDVWTRSLVWKVPLLLLLFSAARPPLNRWAQIYTLLHLISDPIGSLSSLLYTLASCQAEAEKLRARLRQETRCLQGSVWKLYTLLLVSYNECSDTGHSSLFIPEAMVIIEREPEKYRTVRQLFHETARCLAADRCTTFLPVSYAQFTFIQSFAFAFYNVIRSPMMTKAFPTGKKLNVEGYSIAFSALFLSLITIVYLSSIIGASQTEQSIPRLLNSLRRQLLSMPDQLPGGIIHLLPEHITLLERRSKTRRMISDKLTSPSQSYQHIEPSYAETAYAASLPYPHLEVMPGSGVQDTSTVYLQPVDPSFSYAKAARVSQNSLSQASGVGTPTLDTYRRIVYGGLYSSNSSNSHKRYANLHHHTQLPYHTTRLIRILAVILVSTPVVISCLISGSVPPEGLDCRHLAEIPTLIVWLLSWATGRFISTMIRDPRKQFWAKFVKEVIAGGAVISLTMVTVVGMMNRCDCYTMWGRRNFANPIYPDIALRLKHRVRTEWPALIGLGIVMQLGACMYVTWKYRMAARVYLQRDEPVEDAQ